MLPLFASCAGNGRTGEAVQFLSYRDIPGITDEEIAAVESLRGRGSFSYGMLLSTESFIKENGEIGGNYRNPYGSGHGFHAGARYL
jgi:hypothetical protein